MAGIDVAIIGAGVSGLTAARELRRKGLEVAVYEARDRIGGRVLTHRDGRFPAPLELGAEFIHGEGRETERLLREAGLSALDIAGDHWQAGKGKVKPYDSFYERIDHVLDRIDPEGEDRSFDDFLARRRSTSAEDRKAAREFVTGFHAADPSEIGVLSIAPEGDAEPSDVASRVGRVVEGYDRVPAWLARDLGGSLHLGTLVSEVAWERGRVELTLGGRKRKAVARAAVVTVPVGVLQAPPGEPGAIRFHPEPPRLRQTVALLAMGSVVRLVLGFSEFPWKDREELERLSFLHTGGTFRVWWTAYPLRLPVLVGWSGGPPAGELAGKCFPEIRAAALRALAESLGISRRRLEARLEETWMHDWDNDPLSRGAYSYARVGGSEAGKALARPVQGTLFFAGEATDLEGRTGTVEGALAAGLRAARQVAKALS
jgi:monoamine oxidase